MEYIYLVAAMFSSTMLSIMSSLFGRKNEKKQNVSLLYSAIVTCAAFLSQVIICIFNNEFNLHVAGYSIAYGVFYTVAMIGLFKAYQNGSVSLTAFVKQLSLIGVAFWGFVFWDNPITLNIAIGLFFVIAALYLCFKQDKNSGDKTISLRWIVFALMLLVGNAGCSIVQKYQQIAFDGKYGSIFMLFGVSMSFVFSVLLYFRGNRCKIKEISKSTIYYPIIAGVSSAVMNYLIMLLISSPLSESIIFPGIAVGGLVFTLMFSLIVYREKLRLHQWIGLSVGVIALVFLNI